MSTTTATKARTAGVDKVTARRDELAESALLTLADRGYAHTSLRDIAQNSDFSHGVVHYYFRDKIDLITYCVRHYKARCVTRYDGLVATAATAQELGDGFADTLVQTMIEEAPVHRLWYDIRSQSLFEDALVADVTEIDGTLREMVWQVVSRYAELAGGVLAVDARAAYALFDGLFEHALLSHLNSGDPAAAAHLAASTRRLLPTLLA